LTQAEAVMHMELSGQAFMLYFSEEDQKLKVIYRHADGNFAIVEPE
jgi:putative sigma-54 modulation protein